MPHTSAQLSDFLRRAGAGDRAAFAELYAATSAKLYGVVLRISKRRDIADEVLQEAFVRIWSHAASFDPLRASPITWMVAIARNRALDEVRKVMPASLDDLPDSGNIVDPQMLASERLEMTEELDRLHHCLEALEPQRREIVKLAYLDGRSRDELGRMFGHPTATIKTWLHRSLKQLNDCLGS